VEVGIGRYAYGRRGREGEERYCTPNGCSGEYYLRPEHMNIRLTLVLDRVLSCLYTSDARFVLSGSDDGNVRMWKAKPNDRLGVLDGRERSALEYREALKERWKFDKEISRIQRYVTVYLPIVNIRSDGRCGDRSRLMPKAVKNAAQLKRTMLDAQAVKEDRRRKHSRAGGSKPKAERRKVVLAEQS